MAEPDDLLDHDLDARPTFDPPCIDDARCCTPRAHGAADCTFFEDAVYIEAFAVGWRPSDGSERAVRS